MEPIILAVLVGIGVYIGIIALIPKNILSDTSTRYTRSVLQQLERESTGKGAMEDDNASIMREHIEKAGIITRVFFTLPGTKAIYPRLVKAGLGNSIDKFFITCLIVMLLLIYCFKSAGLAGVGGAMAMTYLFAWWVISGRIKKRNDAFLNGFPDALDMVVRSVRSGYPLNAAVRMVADNMQPPINLEFRQVADETNYGSSLLEALNRLAGRIDEPDIRFFVVVLSVQQEVGGNLAEVLNNLAGIIRRRKHLRLKVKAMTSEGRATAWVLGLLPVFVFCLIWFVSPGHIQPFFNTHLGNIMFAIAVGIILLQFFIVSKMINIKV